MNFDPFDDDLDVLLAMGVAAGGAVDAVIEHAPGAALRLFAVLADEGGRVEQGHGAGRDQRRQSFV